MSRELVVHADREALVAETADRFARTVDAVLREQDECHVALTGGSVGTELLGALRGRSLDWSRIHCWWGDERFVPAADGDRNALQAREALLDHVDVPAANVHELPASDAGLDLDAAAQAATAELGDRVLDLVLLGMGPDAHVASLFPGHDGTDAQGVGVIAVRDSPKPPPERLSLTFDALNRARRVWLVVAGDDKASALALAMSTADRHEVPAAGVHGTRETRYLVDRAAASLLPDGMLD
ncbi:6-phosphogluconolactonase [Agrococcus sp. SGAir0287]|uniref:6-phosphogluconolactonase n=1 Tax=Agrococcus sp. SGAir0287 TaxID=2070347 RepID=UPI0010CD2C34|nr:6-phosphogluconolactonase [Agrococcus sp. SGAir0287]QCR19268.1 6-phosphogluconolactonase [Agrococcus sp. SGAir0287]